MDRLIEIAKQNLVNLGCEYALLKDKCSLLLEDGDRLADDIVKIDWLHKVDQLIELSVTKVINNEEVLMTLLALVDMGWLERRCLPISKERQERIASLMYQSSNPNSDEGVIISVSCEGKEIAALIAGFCERDGVRYQFDFRDPRWQVALLMQDCVDSEGIYNLAELTSNKFALAKKQIGLGANRDPLLQAQLDQSKWDLFQKFLKPVHDRKMTGDLFYTITVLPTPVDAELDGMDYNDYVELFFEACDQPWEEIKVAQQILIDRLNLANEIRFCNDDGTDVTLGISGQTFANSVIAKNLPGAEMFSSPIIDQVEGIIVAKGKFQEGNSGLMEDLTFVFEKGKVIDFSARVGESYLRELIEADDGHGEGVRYVGELGIGTNPHLTRQFLNGLLVEKVSGSFHIALGEAYKYDKYCGVPVNLNNGNCSYSGIHWDITTMLRGNGGKIYLDGELIQDDGRWLWDSLQVLNDGWGAIDVERRPSWWK